MNRPEARRPIRRIAILAVGRPAQIPRVHSRFLRRIATTLLNDLLQQDQFLLNLCFIDTAGIQRLNEAFLRHRGPTDVITFDYSEAGSIARPGAAAQSKKPLLHGEIFLCLEVALAQARTYRTTLGRELVRYLIHGVLHLLGYDDKTSPAQREMRRRENQLLAELSARFDFQSLQDFPPKERRPRPMRGTRRSA